MPGRDEIEAVLFDWDGTLADSLADFLAANEAVMRALGVPFDAATYRRVYTPDWRVVYRRLGVSDDRLDEANALWHEHFDLRSPGTLTLPGVPESLARLAAAGLRLGVVTAGDRSVVEPLIGSTGLDDLLEVRVDVGDSPKIKPDPAPLRLALERLGIAARPGAAFYLGDAPDDMRMALAAGVHAVGVASLIGEPDELRAAGAETIVASVAEWVAGWLDARATSVTPPQPAAAERAETADRPAPAEAD
jgi:HAD superfamily hydrolase (TIGR01509 family)